MCINVYTIALSNCVITALDSVRHSGNFLLFYCLIIRILISCKLHILLPLSLSITCRVQRGYSLFIYIYIMHRYIFISIYVYSMQYIYMIKYITRPNITRISQWHLTHWFGHSEYWITVNNQTRRLNYQNIIR